MDLLVGKREGSAGFGSWTGGGGGVSDASGAFWGYLPVGIRTAGAHGIVSTAIIDFYFPTNILIYFIRFYPGPH